MARKTTAARSRSRTTKGGAAKTSVAKKRTRKKGSAVSGSNAPMERRVAREKKTPEGEPVAKAAMIPFEKVPISDTCWSLLTGPDQRLYAAACTEHMGGAAAYMVRYTPATKLGAGKLEYLFDVGDAVGEPADSGRATQCKIHYCLMGDADTGILYGATHLSGAPRGDLGYSWYGSWREEHRSFRGSFLFAFDTATDKILWTDLCYPWEGSRCMALDNRRGLIHGVGFPRDHYFVYDLDRRGHKDFGRIGSVNPQAIWLDSKNTAYTTDDYGWVLRLNPDHGRLERLDVRTPFAPWTDGWHNVVYDVVQDPTDPDVVYGCSWNLPSHIFRYRMDPKGGPGEMTDLGPALPEKGYLEMATFFTDHVGGLVFSDDGYLYYCASDMVREAYFVVSDRKCWLMRMDPATGESEKVGLLKFDDFRAAYVARADRVPGGRIIMGDVANRPSRLYEFQPDRTAGRAKVDVPLRRWG